jgi:hypothetical protein
MEVMELTLDPSSGAIDLPRKVCSDCTENGGGGGDFDLRTDVSRRDDALDSSPLQLDLLLGFTFFSLSKL